MNFRDKIIPWDKLPAWRDAFRARSQTLVVTNGCFDLLHAGHVAYLESARNLGHALIVGLNGDAAVRELKGPNRPVNDAADRAAVEKSGGKIVIIPFVPGKSTTALLQKISRL